MRKGFDVPNKRAVKAHVYVALGHCSFGVMADTFVHMVQLFVLLFLAGVMCVPFCLSTGPCLCLFKDTCLWQILLHLESITHPLNQHTVKTDS